ncbi:MAG TPA: sugar phosphate nucleotidyltransferase [Candidatus Acidoferrales bacterium]|nr:sugar phosphate nucleotidyltransferase [Candidatus Acidoferrales bacterium]
MAKKTVSKCIITSAGEGSRMKRVTSVVPKGLLPLFKTENGARIVVPVADLIMESVSAAGISDFCFVVGRHKSLLMDYLFDRGVTFVFQNKPLGFGDAVLRGADFAHDSAVIVHADDGFLTGGYVEATKLLAEKQADAVLLLRKVDNVKKRYGVAEVTDRETFMGYSAFTVTGVEEKPEKPKSNFMISAAYVFSSRIFDGLRKARHGSHELELTDGIQEVINAGGKVFGLLLEKEKWLNVGNTDSYHRALNYSFENL